MYLIKRPPSYTSDTNNPSFPPPAYAPRTNNDNESNETSSYRRLEFGASRRSDTWVERMFQVDTRRHYTFNRVDTQMGNWGVVCIAIHCVATMILLCVSGVAIKTYQNPWNQSSVIGGATLSYGLAGSILGAITGSLAICFGFWAYLNPIFGLIFHTLILLMQIGSGTLLGYGSYITRNNNICNDQYTGVELHDCYNIRLSAGWRCGIVVIAMCAINVITALAYSLIWFFTWLDLRNKRHSHANGV